MPTENERDILAELMERLEDTDTDTVAEPQAADDALTRLMQVLQGDDPPDEDEKPAGGGGSGDDDSDGGAEASIDRDDDRSEIEPLPTLSSDDTQPTPDHAAALLKSLNSPIPEIGAARIRRPGKVPTIGDNNALGRLMEALGGPVETAPAQQPQVIRYRGPSF